MAITPIDPSEVASLSLWLDADQISGLSNGDPVSTWEDQSGAGADATASGANRPQYQTAQQNGLPGVYFSGSTWLQIGTFAHSAARTVIAVAKLDSSPANVNHGIFGNYTDASNRRAWVLRRTNTNGNVPGFWHSADSTWRSPASGNVLALSTTHIVRFVSPSGDGGLVNWDLCDRMAPVSGGTPPTTGQASVGDTQHPGSTEKMKGWVFELLVFDAVLPRSTCEGIEAYLAAKWDPPEADRYTYTPSGTQSSGIRTFADDTIGSQPPDTTLQWEAGAGEYKVYARSGDLDGQALELDVSSSAVRGLSFDELDGFDDVDIIQRVQGKANGTRSSFVLRGSGVLASRSLLYCYLVTSTGPSFSVRRREAGTVTLQFDYPVPGGYSTTTIGGKWFWVRAQAFGEVLRVKFWEGDLEDDPAEWDSVVSVGTVTTGDWNGVKSFTIGALDGDRSTWDRYLWGVNGLGPNESAASPPDAPTLTVEEGAAAAQLFTSDFSSSQDGETHAQTQWQVTTDDDTDFSAPVVNVTSSTALLGYLADALEGETHYIARARHEGTLGGFSDWSDVVAFTTLAALPAPSLTVAALTDVDVEITSSDFDPDDPERVHVATEWELDVESGDFSSPLESYTTALDLLVATFDGLDPETGYQVRARHIDDLGQQTAWGLISFTTEATPDYRPDTPEITLISATPRESTVLWDTLYNVTVGLLYPYSHPYSVAHQRTQWQYVIGDDPSEDFALPARSVVQNSPSTSWQVGQITARDPFVANQVYQFRVRVQDENDVWSEWSPTYELVIDGPLRPPTLLTPEAGAVVSTDAVLVTWTEYRDPDYESDDHIYELAITRDGGGTWTVIDDSIVIGYSDDPEYLWYLSDLLDGPAQLRIRSLAPNETEWGYGDVFYVDRDTGNVTRLDADTSVTGWSQYGDLSQTWSELAVEDEQCGSRLALVTRNAPSYVEDLVRRTAWAAYAPDLDVLPVEVDATAVFRYTGSGIGGDEGVAPGQDLQNCPGGPGCNPCVDVQRSQSSIPAEENYGGVAVDLAGTYANAVADGTALRGVAAYLRIGEIWPFGGPNTRNFAGNRYAQNAGNAALIVRIETPSSATPGGTRAKATLTQSFPRNSFQHRAIISCGDLPPCTPEAPCRCFKEAIPHAVRLRLTIVGQDQDTGLYNVRIQTQVTGAQSSRGTQKAGWDIDVVRYGFEIQCGACGVFGAGTDYASNAGVQKIHYESLTYQLIRSAALGPALGTPSVEG